MLSRLLGGKKRRKKRGTDDQLAEVLFALNQRRTQLYIPFLERKVAGLRTRIEDKQRTGG